MKVERVEIESRAIYFTVSASSRAEYEVALAAAPSDIFVLDDQGNKYPWRPPAENERLKLSLGDSLEARLGFVGPVVDGAESLTLYVNFNGVGNPMSQELGAYPSFKFTDIPIE